MQTEAKKAYLKRYREENKQRLAAAAAERYQDKKEEYSAYRREWRRSKAKDPHHHSLVLAQKKRYREANHDELHAKQVEFAKAFPGKKAATRHKSRAITRGAYVEGESELAKQKIIELKTPTHGICFYCNDNMPTFGMHIDHVIPLCRGGLHIPENLVLCCATCNSSKGKKLLSEWTPKGKSSQ